MRASQPAGAGSARCGGRSSDSDTASTRRWRRVGQAFFRRTCAQARCRRGPGHRGRGDRRPPIHHGVHVLAADGIDHGAERPVGARGEGEARLVVADLEHLRREEGVACLVENADAELARAHQHFDGQRNLALGRARRAVALDDVETGLACAFQRELAALPRHLHVGRVERPAMRRRQRGVRAHGGTRRHQPFEGELEIRAAAAMAQLQCHIGVGRLDRDARTLRNPARAGRAEGPTAAPCRRGHRRTA